MEKHKGIHQQEQKELKWKEVHVEQLLMKYQVLIDEIVGERLV